jgi:hypothetical protein
LLFYVEIGVGGSPSRVGGHGSLWWCVDKESPLGVVVLRRRSTSFEMCFCCLA